MSKQCRNNPVILSNKNAAAATPMRRYTRWLTAGALLAVIASPAQAQSTLTAREIDRSSPDVVEFLNRTGETSTPSLQQARKLGLPDDQFFAAFDPSRSPSRSESAPDDETLDAAVQDCPVQLVATDPDERRGWFQVNYGTPCNMSLYCNWLVDTQADTSDTIRASEQTLEPDESREPSEEDNSRFSAEDPLIANAENAHTHGYSEVSMKIMLAGTRPCVVTRYCDGRDDLLCTERFLRLKADQITIQQLGE